MASTSVELPTHSNGLNGNIEPNYENSQNNNNNNNNEDADRDSVEEEPVSVSKRFKTKNSASLTNNTIKLAFSKIKNERCSVCKQGLDSLLLYNGHPNNSSEEFVALTDEKLSVFTGKEEEFNDQDDFPIHQVFAVITPKSD